MRANSPATRLERLFDLLCSTSQAHEPWTAEALAEALYCSVRTVKRDFERLRDIGKYPLPRPKIMALRVPHDMTPME